MALSGLGSGPEGNPNNHQGKAIPTLNPSHGQGPSFLFSWVSFLVPFWSWYPFSPLPLKGIPGENSSSPNGLKNFHGIGLNGTERGMGHFHPISGNRLGLRLTLVAGWFLEPFPTFLAVLIRTQGDSTPSRSFVAFFVGTLGLGQEGITGSFNRKIAGPATIDPQDWAMEEGVLTNFLWPPFTTFFRTTKGFPVQWHGEGSFVVPGIFSLPQPLPWWLLLPDTPTGAGKPPESRQHQPSHSMNGAIVDIPGGLTQTPSSPDRSSSTNSIADEEKKLDYKPTSPTSDTEKGESLPLTASQSEIIASPTFSEMIRVIFSGPTLVLGACYFCTFGAELSINSVLGTFYQRQLGLGLQNAGNLAAIFGLLNIVMRPLGGMASDLLYRKTGSVWSKKALLHTYCVMTGVFCIAIGLARSRSQATLVGLVSGGLAFFLEGANGLTYSHVHPYANGVVSGFTGACGNLGGIVFAIVFRYNSLDYSKVFWIIGAIIIGLQVATCWIKPVPKSVI
uniref:Elsinochrome transporter 1 n=1 Tax=Elsinoe fawcettii TaxID=40997 RepID=ECT1_ELSFA|nr:RecName: Full=Elsinochrome transporter 1; AltName: Full=Elsinochromes biosynthesis cluster protein ECT1 [Elsinoe fawcettii]ABZ82008.1 ECT1 transporter [Elsinoe fawcettii]